MKTKQYFFVFAFACVHSVCFAGIGLYDTYIVAKENNIQYKKAIEQNKSSTNKKNATRSMLLPQINFNIGGSTGRTIQNIPYSTGDHKDYNGTSSQYGITVIQSIFNYKNIKNYESLQYLEYASQEQLEISKESLIENVFNIYIDNLTCKNREIVLEDERKAVQSLLTDTKNRYEIGVIAKTSLDEAEARMSKINAQYFYLKYTKDKCRSDFFDIIGMYPDEIIDTNSDAKSLREMIEHTMLIDNKDMNHNIMMQRYSELASQKNMESNFGGYLPNINLALNLGNSYVGNYDGTGLGYRMKSATIGITLDFPVYQGGMTDALYDQSKHTYEINRLEMIDTERRTSIQINSLKKEIEYGYSMFIADEKMLEADISLLNTMQSAYRVGTRTMTDVLNQISSVSSSKMKILEDVYNVTRMLIEYTKNIGTLNDNYLKYISEKAFA